MRMALRHATLEPAASLRALFGGGTPPPLHALLGLPDNDRLLRTYSGTTAIYQALRAFGVDTGRRVLVPAYNCGHEVEAVLRSGATPVAYRVDQQLDIDLNDVYTRLREGPTGLVMVTHFLGRVAPLGPLRALCAEAGVPLLEDCAQALFSENDGQRAGSAADGAVFSLRKTLALPGGGVLALRGRTPAAPSDALPLAPLLTRTTRVSYLCYKGLAAPGLQAATSLRHLLALVALGADELCYRLQQLSVRLGYPQHEIDDERFDYPDALLGWGMDHRSQAMLARVVRNEVIALRRDHHTRLHTLLRDLPGHVSLLPNPLPRGLCPLYYVFAAADRDTVLRVLHGRGVPALALWSLFHPAIDWQNFPEAVRLKATLIALPVHQHLSAMALESMAMRVRQALGGSR